MRTGGRSVRGEFRHHVDGGLDDRSRGPRAALRHGRPGHGGRRRGDDRGRTRAAPARCADHQQCGSGRIDAQHHLERLHQPGRQREYEEPHRHVRRAHLGHRPADGRHRPGGRGRRARRWPRSGRRRWVRLAGRPRGRRPDQRDAVGEGWLAGRRREHLHRGRRRGRPRLRGRCVGRRLRRRRPERHRRRRRDRPPGRAGGRRRLLGRWRRALDRRRRLDLGAGDVRGRGRGRQRGGRRQRRRRRAECRRRRHGQRPGAPHRRLPRRRGRHLLRADRRQLRAHGRDPAPRQRHRRVRRLLRRQRCPRRHPGPHRRQRGIVRRRRRHGAGPRHGHRGRSDHRRRDHGDLERRPDRPHRARHRHQRGAARQRRHPEPVGADPAHGLHHHRQPVERGPHDGRRGRREYAVGEWPGDDPRQGRDHGRRDQRDRVPRPGAAPHHHRHGEPGQRCRS